MLKHGARVDVEARMCWPGPHQHNCEERSKNVRKGLDIVYPSSDKLQCAIYYAIDGDQVIEIEPFLGRDFFVHAYKAGMQ